MGLRWGSRDCSTSDIGMFVVAEGAPPDVVSAPEEDAPKSPPQPTGNVGHALHDRVSSLLGVEKKHWQTLARLGPRTSATNTPEAGVAPTEVETTRQRPTTASDTSEAWKAKTVACGMAGVIGNAACVLYVML